MLSDDRGKTCTFSVGRVGRVQRRGPTSLLDSLKPAAFNLAGRSTVFSACQRAIARLAAARAELTAASVLAVGATPAPLHSAVRSPRSVVHRSAVRNIQRQPAAWIGNTPSSRPPWLPRTADRGPTDPRICHSPNLSTRLSGPTEMSDSSEAPVAVLSHLREIRPEFSSSLNRPAAASPRRASCYFKKRPAAVYAAG